MWQPGELDRPKVRVVGHEELLIGKLLALFDRGAARDVWDVANLSTETTGMVTAPAFRSRFIAFSVILDHPLPTYTKERLKRKLTDRAVSVQLAPMLSTPEIPRSVDLIDRAWAVVQELLDLAPNEKEYLSAIQQGELRPQLLFPNGSEDCRMIPEHPAIGWKVVNVQNHLAKKSKRKGIPYGKN